MEIIVKEDGIRIDSYLIDKLNMSRSKAQNLVKNGNITVNYSVIKNSYKVKENDLIIIDEIKKESTKIVGEKMNLDIVYEDDYLMVINKPKGLVVHPAAGNKSGTLVNGLVYYTKHLSKNNSIERPGIVHRIDADTSGLLVVAKDDETHEKLAKQLESKTVTRKYVALVWGVINNDTGTIDAPIGRDVKDRKKMSIVATGKKAITHFKVLERFKDSTYIELRLETGRTHQIRVHMNYIGFPIVNDSVYSRRKPIDGSGQCLHACVLGFIHPKTEEYMEFKVDAPLEFVNIYNQLKSL
jgi:23S rRNA pseudouridine1911/1915/1917 synthase